MQRSLSTSVRNPIPKQPMELGASLLPRLTVGSNKYFTRRRYQDITEYTVVYYNILVYT